MKPVLSGDRPPYARFEVRPVEDREATIANKVYTTKDVVYALITPSGSRDVVIKVADEWFEQMEQFVREERFSPQWLEYYRAQYEAFLKNQEPALDGTDIRNWSYLSPSQINTLRGINVRTVEELASLNEEGIRRLGMGGRELKAKAEEFILQNDVRTTKLLEENDKLTAQLQEMANRLAALESAAKPAADSPTAKALAAAQAAKQ